MHRLTWFVVIGFALAGAALAALPPEADIQGLYEGACKDAKGEQKLEARLVDCGKGAFKAFIRKVGADGKTMKAAELDGKVEADALKFAGKAGDVEWTAAYADGTLKGACGPGCTLDLKRVVRESPTLGAKPPAGAIVLLDGKNFDEVVKKPLKDGKEQEWKLVDGGGIQVPTGGLASKRTFDGSLKIHIEFKNPLMPDGRGQGRGNSGAFLPCGQEIQVLDSFGMTTYTGGGCGGLYKYKDPDAFDEFSLASAPPLQWQTYDIEYRVEKQDGKPAGKPRLTVFHNGIKIHDNLELKQDAKPGNVNFQDHGNPVHYRNIWVLPLDGK
jgi:hypothetical protein